VEDKGGGDRGNLWGERAGWRGGENLRILRDIRGGSEEKERESNFYSVLLYGSRQAEARHIQSAPETGFLRGWGRLVSSTVCGFCKLSFLSHSPLLRNNMLLLLLCS
jgi:hypothetical protein